MAGRIGAEGWGWERAVAGAAGAFLLWRGLFGRARGGALVALAGAAILGRVFAGRVFARAATGAAREASRGAAARGSPEVIEVKSPAELEPGIASGSPQPTFPDRVDRPHGPPLGGGSAGPRRS